MASLIKSSQDSSRLDMGEESPSEERRLDLKGLISDLRFTPFLGSLTNCSSLMGLSQEALLLRIQPKYEDI